MAQRAQEITSLFKSAAYDYSVMGALLMGSFYTFSKADVFMGSAALVLSAFSAMSGSDKINEAKKEILLLEKNTSKAPSSHASYSKRI
jgi:hypothetical protein